MSLVPTGTKLLYGTYLGGSELDSATSMVFDPTGNIWLSGSSGSTDFPTTSNALQPTNTSNGYSFTVTEFSPATSSILYSTYLGGTTDSGLNAALLALDGFGNLHLAGSTSSTTFPVTANASNRSSATATPLQTETIFSIPSSDPAPSAPSALPPAAIPATPPSPSPGLVSRAGIPASS